MKSLVVLFSLFALPCLAVELSTDPKPSVGGTIVVAKDIAAETRDCKVQHSPGVILYGLCYTEGKTVIFKSCAEFTCQLDAGVIAGPVEEVKKSCFSDKDPVKFKDEALLEHSVKSLSQIKNCGYGAKK